MRCSRVIFLPKRESSGTNTRSYTGISPMMARMLNSCSERGRKSVQGSGPGAYSGASCHRAASRCTDVRQHLPTGWLLE